MRAVLHGRLYGIGVGFTKLEGLSGVPPEWSFGQCIGGAECSGGNTRMLRWQQSNVAKLSGCGSCMVHSLVCSRQLGCRVARICPRNNLKRVELACNEEGVVLSRHSYPVVDLSQHS